MMSTEVVAFDEAPYVMFGDGEGRSRISFLLVYHCDKILYSVLTYLC